MNFPSLLNTWYSTSEHVFLKLNTFGRSTFDGAHKAALKLWSFSYPRTRYAHPRLHLLSGLDVKLPCPYTMKLDSTMLWLRLLCCVSMSIPRPDPDSTVSMTLDNLPHHHLHDLENEESSIPRCKGIYSPSTKGIYAILLTVSLIVLWPSDARH
jgi:hypothetical protein